MLQDVNRAMRALVQISQGPILLRFRKTALSITLSIAVPTPAQLGINYPVLDCVTPVLHQLQADVSSSSGRPGRAP